MTAAPRRLQRQRTKGWRKPPEAVYVGRPSRWGNHWTLRDAWNHGVDGAAEQRAWAVARYRAEMTEWVSPSNSASYWRETVAELRGKDLICWCPLDQPCHADVLLELANCDATPPPAHSSGGVS